MKITALVENTSSSGDYQKRHGLSFYIETGRYKLLFDLGPDDAFLSNARKMGIDVADVDTVVISHGHDDHGGGLKTFLQNNGKAKIYIRKGAFGPHYAEASPSERYIGLDKSLANDARIVFTGNEYKIDDGLFLFSNVQREKLAPSNNSVLLTKSDTGFVRDDFSHEQNLLITENGTTALFAGCSHRDIVNIMDAAMGYASSVDYVIAGFHMLSPTAKKMEDESIIRQICVELEKYHAKYLTCHCTGVEAFTIMKGVLGEKIDYISTGGHIEI